MTFSNRTKRTAAAFVAAVIVSVGSSGIAQAAPYYFQDQNSNPQALYTNPSCDGETDSCIGFGTKCGVDMYYSKYSQQRALEMWKYKGYIKIRQNSGGHEVVCELIR
ncbi:hypothetical protein [Maritalea porphyrae]|jgi:hypothetical protein|uniref:hypothetical protein n=1 Tax=Maritalea porphyrae TaxID=880732 RepID=UPI0022B078A8|nr:hypothetical protein [Maritalea porphyrae]MCZ4273052.1 hypothetical protein [Maritalea porphyrae]